MRSLYVGDDRDIAKMNQMTHEERMADLRLEDEAKARRRRLKNIGPFRRYSQLNNAYCLTISRLARQSPMAVSLFFFLASIADRRNAVKPMTQAEMAKKIGASQPAVSDAIKTLLEHKLISARKDGKANVYAINHAVLWRDKKDKTRLSEFKEVGASEELL